MSFQAAGSPSLCTINSCKEVYTLGLISSVRSAKTAIRLKILARTYLRPSVHAYLKPCMVWPYSANLECRSEMCCMRLAGNAGPKNSPKIPRLSLSTHADFKGFRVLTALLHGTPVLGVSQTLRRWTEGATYIRQGDHRVGHWPTFLVFSFSLIYYWSYHSSE